MRALMCREFGPPEKLSVEEVPDPVPGEGEIVVDVKAAAIGFPDVLTIQDLYQFKEQVPYVPGGEVAGVVSAVGPGAEGVAVGDRVCAGMRNGGFAEKAKTQAASARPLPGGLEFEQATGLLYAYGTGFLGIRERGQLQKGETLLVLGAAGSVGMAAIEIGKHLGARVIAAASSPEKLELCRACGADDVIDYAK